MEADIKDCFGAFDHDWMRKILSRRIRDGVLIRTIGKWLNAGIMEGGRRTRPTKGTPQGGVISPLLANIFLHEVLDAWFHRYAKPLIGGLAELVRFADDFVILCDRKEDAERSTRASIHALKSTVWSCIPRRRSSCHSSVRPRAAQTNRRAGIFSVSPISGLGRERATGQSSGRRWHPA